VISVTPLRGVVKIFTGNSEPVLVGSPRHIGTLEGQDENRNWNTQGPYQQWRRFPQAPQLGNQIVQVWGSYSVNGNMLTTTPAGMQVMNGLDPHQICNVQTHQCKALDLPPPETIQLTQVDAKTVRTPDGGTAHRME
jgi:hypothetical protein